MDMTDALFETMPSSLFAALVAAGRRFGNATPILEDPERSPLNYGRLILGSIVLGDKFARETDHEETVGVLLPNVNAAAVTLFGLSAFGRVAAMLNFTAGLKNIRAAIAAADVRTVITSRRFVETARLEDVVAGLTEPQDGRAAIRVVYLEDIRASVTSLDKALAVVVKTAFLRKFISRHALGPDRPAVILFTSGSEGEPKGVALSAGNLSANIRQIMAHIGSPPLGREQIILNPLPIFHSFGLTGGLLLGVLTGMRVILYPSPLHYRQIARLAKETGATVLFGTDTFLQGWMRAAEDGEFASMRIVVAGAERVKDETRARWASVGALVLEGYGATECAPVIAVNQPHANRPGTVGRLLPEMEARIIPVEGIQDGGRLEVRGPNVMLGYLFPRQPGLIIPTAEGWHDTGDIVTMDDAGAIIIKGRAKRFAKIGGEMISLAAIESMASALWPCATHVAIAMPDPKRGEQVILVTDRPDAEKGTLVTFAQSQGYPELWTPRAILVTAAIPVLGSGKIDMVAVQELARSMRSML
jgi:acyl-[acyl-carrier-protein]-phospholipid O-acyltransferase/long-chain-fatty-acid--[acyl-carrier-protein] ligase